MQVEHRQADTLLASISLAIGQKKLTACVDFTLAARWCRPVDLHLLTSFHTDMQPTPVIMTTAFN